jgi:hypothetical protein
VHHELSTGAALPVLSLRITMVCSCEQGNEPPIFLKCPRKS